MLILLHTSKTMRLRVGRTTTTPALLHKTLQLHEYTRSLTVEQLMSVMKISRPLAEKTARTLQVWSADKELQSPAALTFHGDIYSGLQAGSWSTDDWTFADEHMRILSGLYGVLRPSDGVMPYRLEMGYRLPDEPYKNLYKFWGSDIANVLPSTDCIVNLTAVEYGKTVTDFLPANLFVTPKFLTISAKTRQPTFVTVHAKIARGAFVSWMIKNKVVDVADLHKFSDIGYKYDTDLSTSAGPVFVCQEFGGKGLSVRLT